jgi:hypothetical protein
MIAILALCSAAGATSLSRQYGNSDIAAPQLAVIADDLGFHQDAVQQSFPDEPPAPLVTTSIGRTVVLSDDDLARYAVEFTQISDPEPPALTTLTLGLAFLAAAGIIHRTRAERRRWRRRRTLVRMRAIIAAR